MIDLRFRPIDRPVATPKAGHKRSPFKAGFTRVLNDLERELVNLKANDIVIEAALDLGDIRNDGWPRSSARPRTPGIRLSFASRHGPLSYECATYDDWEDNLRGIGLTLEALRAIERYGAVKGGQQYKGWAALPPSGSVRIVEDAANALARLAYDEPTPEHVAEILGSRDGCTKARNAAMKLHHPDRNLGTAESTRNTQAALRAFETIVAAMGFGWAKGARS